MGSFVDETVSIYLLSLIAQKLYHQFPIQRQIDTAARPTIEGKTNKDSKEVQTETLELTATPLPNGLVKVKTGANTDDTVYNGWYSAVYQTPSEESEEGQG